MNDDSHNARPVLVVGGTGQIGRRVAQRFAAQGRAVVRTGYRNVQDDARRLDASDRGAVLALVRAARPGLIVNSLNAAGGTDACEDDPALAARAHFDTARHVTEGAVEVGARLVQVSTDYVFNGAAGPYGEQDAPAPLSRLGEAKLRAERYVLEQVPGALVLRTSFVFSWSPEVPTKNFVMQLLDAHARGESMRVPVDQVGNVTYADNFADALVELALGGAAGLFHVAGATRCSKYAWARRVIEAFGLRPDCAQGVTTSELGQRGPRPLASGFKLDKALGALRRTRLLSLDEALEAMQQAMGRVRQPA